MTTPTPRCDAAEKNGALFAPKDGITADFARQLETELAEARAERDASRETCKRLNHRCQQAESIVAKSGIVEGRKQGPKNRSLGRALANYAAAQSKRERDEAQSDLIRLRAVADELAAALERIAGQRPSRPDYWNTCGQCESNSEDAKELLARYHAATNPAAVAANTGVNHRTE